ncbi:MAG TPA: ATP-binding protein [Nitrospiria bacterium]|jgi:two-component system sensor histidine kinase PilS (NtrC family)|nr:ATP-binding protein [Nitrospiria bacterium]
MRTMELQWIQPEEIRAKLKWLMVLRVVIVTVLLGASIVLQVGYGHIGKTTTSFSYLIASTYCLTIVYGILLNRLKVLTLFAYVQIFIDLIYETLLVYLTGGIESPFSPFYMITSIAASVILGRKGGSLTASMASVLLGLLVDLQYFGFLPETAASTYSDRETLYFLFLNVVGFLTVAYLSGGLAEKLSLTRERLKEKAAGLAELKAFHEHVVQSMSTGLMTTGLSGEITSFNRAAEEIIGYRYGEVRDRPWWEIFGSPDLKELISAEKPLMEPYRFDRECHRKDGGALVLGMTVSPLKNENGQQIGGVWIFQDLTRIRKMELEIEHKKRLATIGEMAAGMAHEIRNPLASLSGSMQVLSRDLRLDDEESRRLMEIALRETERLNGIITAFLLYARPSPLNKKRWDINQLVRDTLSLLRQGNEYQENIDIQSSLAPGDLDAVVDADQIRQVFWNLSINACQAMPQGGRLLVTTRSVTMGPDKKSPETAWVEVTFSDDGHGIQKEHMDKIFYPFFTTKDRGSGLGLSIVHRVIETHQGRVHVESQPGEGTRFILLLPVGEPTTSVRIEKLRSR